MEKKRPTYDLAAVQATFANPSALAITLSALRDAIALGFGSADIVGIIQTMDRKMFVKSITTFADHARASRSTRCGSATQHGSGRLEKCWQGHLKDWT